MVCSCCWPYQSCFLEVRAMTSPAQKDTAPTPEQLKPSPEMVAMWFSEWSRMGGNERPCNERNYIAIKAAQWGAQQVSGNATSQQWRCFHCDETFTDKNSAAEHFGVGQHVTPGCIE